MRGTLLAGSSVVRWATTTPSASATTSNSTAVDERGEAPPGRHRGGADAGVEGDPLDLVEVRGGQRRAVGPDACRRSGRGRCAARSATRGCRRRRPGCRSGSGRARGRRRRCVPACARSRGSQTCENGCVRHQHERGRRRPHARPTLRTRPCEAERALDHRGDGDRHQDGVVLVPGVPVGAALGEEPPAEGGQRDDQQHRRAQREQAGRAAAGRAPCGPCGRRPPEDAPARRRGSSGRSCRRRCRCRAARCGSTPISSDRRRPPRTPSHQAPAS